MLWRLRDVPGQSTLTAFPFQPVSRSAAIAEGSKAHHRPAVTTPDKARALPDATERGPTPGAELESLNALNALTERGSSAENRVAVDEEQFMQEEGAFSKGSRQHSGNGGHLSIDKQAPNFQVEDHLPWEVAMPAETLEDRPGSSGATGKVASELQEAQDQHSDESNATVPLDSKANRQHVGAAERVLQTGNMHSSLGRTAEIGNEGWQSSMESPQPLPQPALAQQQNQVTTSEAAEQQTRLEHMLPGDSLKAHHLQAQDDTSLTYTKS